MSDVKWDNSTLKGLCNLALSVSFGIKHIDRITTPDGYKEVEGFLNDLQAVANDCAEVPQARTTLLEHGLKSFEVAVELIISGVGDATWSLQSADSGPESLLAGWDDLTSFMSRRCLGDGFGELYPRLMAAMRKFASHKGEFQEWAQSAADTFEDKVATGRL